jgi:hypothetical protein
MTDLERIKSLKEYIKYKERAISGYASGVRSGATSADIAMDRSALARAAMELSKLEAKQ